MRYLVTARVKADRARALERAIDEGTLGRGSVAGDEYFRNMSEARAHEDGRVQWEKVQDAHARSRCKDLNGTDAWSCGDCDCSARLEARLAAKGRPFLDTLRTKT
jgi:hypothetical protein